MHVLSNECITSQDKKFSYHACFLTCQCPVISLQRKEECCFVKSNAIIFSTTNRPSITLSPTNSILNCWKAVFKVLFTSAEHPGYFSLGNFIYFMFPKALAAIRTTHTMRQNQVELCPTKPSVCLETLLPESVSNTARPNCHPDVMSHVPKP